MARDCTDGAILDSGGHAYRWLMQPDAIVGRSTSPGTPRECYAVGRNNNAQTTLSRYDAVGALTHLMAGTVNVGTLPGGLRCVGSGISLVYPDIDTALYACTDSVYPQAGDWYVRLTGQYKPFTEASFINYDAPAPSGPAHRVIGSGVVNSRAIVRGAA